MNQFKMSFHLNRTRRKVTHKAWPVASCRHRAGRRHIPFLSHLKMRCNSPFHYDVCHELVEQSLHFALPSVGRPVNSLRLPNHYRLTRRILQKYATLFLCCFVISFDAVSAFPLFRFLAAPKPGVGGSFFPKIPLAQTTCVPGEHKIKKIFTDVFLGNTRTFRICAILSL